jgi:hypothetical protein
MTSAALVDVFQAAWLRWGRTRLRARLASQGAQAMWGQRFMVRAVSLAAFWSRRGGLPRGSR